MMKKHCGHLGRRRLASYRAGGFTLIESALTTIIVGTGVLAIVAAQQAYHQKNGWAQRSGTAMLLANELRELTLSMPLHDPLSGSSNYGPEADETGIADYDDLDDFAGTVDASGIGAGLTFDPPVNALREQIDGMDGWAQQIEVENVLPDNIATSFTQPLGTTDLVRVTVTVTFDEDTEDNVPGTTVTQLTWVVTD